MRQNLERQTKRLKDMLKDLSSQPIAKETVPKKSIHSIEYERPHNFKN